MGRVAAVKKKTKRFQEYVSRSNDDANDDARRETEDSFANETGGGGGDTNPTCSTLDTDSMTLRPRAQ